MFKYCSQNPFAISHRVFHADKFHFPHQSCLEKREGKVLIVFQGEKNGKNLFFFYYEFLLFSSIKLMNIYLSFSKALSFISVL